MDDISSKNKFKLILKIYTVLSGSKKTILFMRNAISIIYLSITILIWWTIFITIYLIIIIGSIKKNEI
jgi:hypothetical protein